jgi:Ethanolamine utilization protein EutJ (predicted chaperonin)/ribosomal protein S13
MDASSAYPPEDLPIIGSHAFNGWGTASAETRKTYHFRFRSHFKPDIEHSSEARQNAEDFLKGILREARKNDKKLFPLESHVIIGVPSEASVGFHNALKTIAKNAGYGDVDLVDEPIGAMLSSIASQQFLLSEILAGLLVVDFGGGTCDFAFLQDGRVKHSWGDMDLGGQLFDDLFYRWYCDQYPSKEQEIEKNKNDFYVRTFICRTWKERFSQDVRNNINRPSATSLRENFGVVTGTWEEFLYRAKNYTPTTSFIKYQEEIGSPLSQRLKSGKTDLIQQFQDLLELGLKERHIAIQDVHSVTLAGGSCQWLFVSEYCKQIFKGTKIFMSDNVYAAIAEGLAVLPALQRDFKERRVNVEKELPSIYADIRKNIESSLTTAKQLIVSKILDELFDNRIKPYLISFRERGGTILSLEDTIAQDIEQFKPRLNQLVKDAVAEKTITLYSMAFERLKMRLKEHHLHLDVDTASINANMQIQLANPEIGDSIAETTSKVAGNIAGLIVMALGFLLAAGGPLTILLAGLTRIVITFIGEKKAKEFLNTFFIPAKALYFVLTNAQIDKARQNINSCLDQELDKVSQNITNEIQSNLESIVNAEIKRLDVANIIR